MHLTNVIVIMQNFTQRHGRLDVILSQKQSQKPGFGMPPRTCSRRASAPILSGRVDADGAGAWKAGASHTTLIALFCRFAPLSPKRELLHQPHPLARIRQRPAAWRFVALVRMDGWISYYWRSASAGF